VSVIQLVNLSRDDVIAAKNELGDLYRRAFHVDSDERIERFISNSLVQHTGYAEYRCVIAKDSEGVIAGFVYGYLSQPGRWWHDTVAPAIREHGKGEYLNDAFEFVEFAVLPEFQGRGIGTALHDRILSQTSQAHALLSTDAETNPAHDLYLRLGWIDLVPKFMYPGGGGAAVLMGLDLHDWRDASLSTRRSTATGG
jgi:GNAT superfamily N-acetyltransferase